MSGVEQAKALFFEGLRCLDAGDPQGAERNLRGALSLVPKSGPVLINLAIVLMQQGKLAEARELAERAIAADEKNVDAYLVAADCLQKDGDFAGALAIFDQVTKLDPAIPEVHNNRGTALLELRQPARARDAFAHALKLNPNFAQAWFGLGNCLTQLDQPQEALSAYRSATRYDPNLIEGWIGIANISEQGKRYDEAIAAYDQAIKLKPDFNDLQGIRLHAKGFICDWTDWSSERSRLLDSVRKGMRVSQAFVLLAISDSASDQLLCANAITQSVPKARSFPSISKAHDRLRLAYVSGDFQDHPVSHLLAGVIERHDRTRIETIAISFGKPTTAPMSLRMRQAFERFVDVQQKSDAEIVEIMRDLKVDIAVDLMGHTAKSRLTLFAARTAPVQVNLIGYPGTIGGDFIDYIIADAVTIPKEQRANYSEQIVLMPDTFQPTDAKAGLELRLRPRAEWGLPSNGFAYCCFSNTYKITPEMFDVWMRILRRTEGSILWLLGGGDLMENNLCREASSRGVDPARLVFARRVPYTDYLARYTAADLFLDTLPFNGGTTASDALWAGLPLITCPGEAFAARMAASLLTALKMPELIAGSLQDYEDLAVRMVGDKALHASIKGKLAQNRRSAPLFDTARYTRHLESAYLTMWERARRGEKPESFAVDPIN